MAAKQQKKFKPGKVQNRKCLNQKVLEVKCLNQKGTDPQGFELVPFSIQNIFCIFR